MFFEFHSFLLDLIFLLLKSIFRNSFNNGLEGIKLTQSLDHKNLLFLFLILHDSFIGYRILDWSLFSLSILEIISFIVTSLVEKTFFIRKYLLIGSFLSFYYYWWYEVTPRITMRISFYLSMLKICFTPLSEKILLWFWKILNCELFEYCLPSIFFIFFIRPSPFCLPDFYFFLIFFFLSDFYKFISSCFSGLLFHWVQLTLQHGG